MPEDILDEFAQQDSHWDEVVKLVAFELCILLFVMVLPGGLVWRYVPQIIHEISLLTPK